MLSSLKILAVAATWIISMFLMNLLNCKALKFNDHGDDGF